MEFLHPAMWHDHDIDFVRWLHPAMCYVALESWQWIHQVAAPCTSTLQCDTWLWDGMPLNSPGCSTLQCDTYSSRLRKFCSLPQVLFGEKVLCHSCSQSFWWQMFCCSWTTYLEQLICQSARQPRKSAAQNSEDNWKHSYFRRTAARRDFFIIALYKYSYLLTYLLTYVALESWHWIRQVAAFCNVSTCRWLGDDMPLIEFA